MKDAQNDPVKKAGLIRDIVISISKIPDRIEREIYTMSTSKQYLTLKNWFIVSSVFTLLMGLIMVIAPQILASPAGMILDDIGIHSYRGGGAVYIGVGIIYWFGRKDGPSDTQKGILYGSFVFNVFSL